MLKPVEGRKRVVIEGVAPEIDCGQYPIKRVVGDQVRVEADLFGDGHDRISCALLYKSAKDRSWREVEMEPLGNDRWTASFAVAVLGQYRYTVEGWVDHFKTWFADMGKRVQAGQDVAVDLVIGANLLDAAAKRARGEDAKRLHGAAKVLREQTDVEVSTATALDPELAKLVGKYPDKTLATRYEKELKVTVDHERAAFSAWYEMFPRSTSEIEGVHGTFQDCIKRLPYISAMGFDVLYLPPIHPIGRSFRKGKNNSTVAGEGDVGSPWAIGAAEGGHTALHPELGSMEDFEELIAEAKKAGLDLAMDIAFQCAPEHPFVKQHPEFFLARPDGTIQYAENPPKKYQDIYPLNFESKEWRLLWDELKKVFLFWSDHGVHIFRVDNPHTKAFPFWEWVIAEVKAKYPETIFLAEAFTRPKVMGRLAKLGFSQSYTYFTWRNTKAELTEYLEQLTQTELREYFRPNFWPNTPDILHESLQTGGRAASQFRFILAATLTSNYGIYGPAFELSDVTPVKRPSEEYLDSEKYQIRRWNLDDPQSLAGLITRVNGIRKAHTALHRNERIVFHATDNPMLICYSKSTRDLSDIVLVTVNLDPVNTQGGWVSLDLAELGVVTGKEFFVTDLLNDAVYSWRGERNFVQLTPGVTPAHIFSIRQEP